MLSCDEALELISARLDGPLTQEETARLEEHLSACPACRTLAEDLKELHEELPQLAAQPPAGLKEGVMDQIHTSKVTPSRARSGSGAGGAWPPWRRWPPWCWWALGLWTSGAPAASGAASRPPAAFPWRWRATCLPEAMRRDR